MVAGAFQKASKSPSVIFIALLLIAVAGFIAVNHLVVRFHEQEKALGRHLYAQAQAEQSAGRMDRAIPYLRAAISYSSDDAQYQLSLARALRDTGRTEEAESYLIRLWEKDPQDGPINLALGRLFARENKVAGAIQYYHNAAYALWPPNSPMSGLAARFELVRYLLQRGALTDAQSELISISSVMPDDANSHLQLGDLFFQAQDFERALAEYQQALRKEPSQVRAALGAGKAAFELRRYREAENYLSRVSQDGEARPLLEISRLTVRSDPYDPSISSGERAQRIRQAFEHAGARLNQCASENARLEPLQQQWDAAKPKVLRRSARLDDELNAAWELALEIEQRAEQCAGSTAQDRALLLLAKGDSRTQP